MENNNNINEKKDESIDIKYIENPDVSKSLVDNVKKKKGILGVLAVIGAVLVKFKFVVFFIFAKLKFLLIALKLGKFASTLISMLFMIVIYAQMYGWAYGLGFVLLILAHEMGHYFVARNLNIDVSGPVFIPFFGAFISMKDQPTDAVAEAKTAAGGPILGSLAALMCVGIYMISGNNLFLALAYTGFMINLFNLIPVHPLDGGRIVTAISPKIWLIGIPMLLYISFKFFNPMIILFLILGCVQAYKQWKKPDADYYNTSMSTKIIFSIIYFGLMALLGIGIFYIHNIHFIYTYR
jgi:Zn-dependent protease